MGFEHVEGENRGKVTLYALSTCVWCKKTKKLLQDLGVEYSYIYVDLLKGDERKRTLEEVKRHNPNTSFPTTVIDEDMCIVGYKEKEIKEALGL
ncbi:MAG TPA: glutaredoxin family protein [Methanothrix sp.]|nr:glutaredoxin family protein [Methanothrix sp.]HPJ83768.1 glutaredoxin family protein [Methanothrix sp.]HPR67543.1 glutaredoxin family protein [Methanothrix sp.]